ncbi:MULTISPECIES: hypothetical protein [Vibrio]|uniref:hypothetical protein n=1 Tax=Vibrio TaxID=662 RepID=UPI00030BC447|nr:MULTISPECIES: hypothetical protein [Vibrio]ARC94807.1 hypothetical protein B6A42_25660 [Vibrio coralliilyticus]MCC2522154.1 hypothetical protein [Vibrio coralliilyticus]MCM5508310.1 hypothetical protein [Vibrio sp. SCSIO 43169]MDE3897016.1 hypothetical protein [Vibrio sp. CC007]NOH41328.1 hypothetical protein [Vibrio coralliilyticus]
MTLSITRLRSSHHRWLFALLVLTLLAGCASSTRPQQPEMTQLQVRQMQTREYSEQSERNVLRAVIGALQDEGYILTVVEPELGLVTAAMELDELDNGTKSFNDFFYGPGSGTYQTVRRVEVSATVQEKSQSVRVRLNIVAKALTNTGGTSWSQPVYSAKTYQDIFSKVDKSVFLTSNDL